MIRKPARPSTFRRFRAAFVAGLLATAFVVPLAAPRARSFVGRIGGTIPPVVRYPAQIWPMFEVNAWGRKFRTATFDGHVHTAYSHDARHPVRDVLHLGERVALDAIMFTDHGTSLAERDVAHYDGPITPIVGAEIGGRYGHALTWGFVGASRKRDRSIEDMPGLGHVVHELNGMVVLAHPGWFIEPNFVNPRYYMQYDVIRRGGRGEAIDGIEVWNATYPARTESLVDEWLSLLDRRVYVPITGGTDFHRVGQVDLGSPRNVVLCPVDDRGEFVSSRRECILEGARAGRLYLTDGPIIDLQVNGRVYGEVLDTAPGKRIHVDVRAIAWTGGNLRVRIGHTDVRTFPLEPGVERYERIVLEAPATDTYVLAEIERPVRLANRPGISAITNPIRLDVAPHDPDWRGPTTTASPSIPPIWTRAGRRRGLTPP